MGKKDWAVIKKPSMLIWDSFRAHWLEKVGKQWLEIHPDLPMTDDQFQKLFGDSHLDPCF